jgi:coenzyme F420-reducing hydrogenase delta subunit
MYSFPSIFLVLLMLYCGSSLKIPTGPPCNLLTTINTKVKTLEAFQQRRNAFKVIAGLHNFDLQYVSRVAQAANAAGASLVDIACSPQLVKAAKAVVDNDRVSICVSGVNPEEFVPAVEAGADMIEIGNFDGFYLQGKLFTARQIVDITRMTRKLCPSVALSVTVPHILSLDEQMSLSKELEECGADLIQTEGKVLPVQLTGHLNAQDSIQRAATTLASTYAIAKTVSIPVMCSSGLDEVTAAIALNLGAKGVGVGRHITQHYPDIVRMEKAACVISKAINRQPIDEEMQLTHSFINSLMVPHSLKDAV